MKARLSGSLLAAILLVVAAPCGATITFPFIEDFSSGQSELNMDPVNGSLTFNNFTYSVDGSGGVALFDVIGFLGPVVPTGFSGLAVFGDWQWTGDSTHSVQTFTVASSDNSPFALTSLDWMTGDGGPPTVFTITGYRGVTPVAQVVGIDLEVADIYGASTSSEIIATDIGADPYPGLHLVFSGSDWSNIDRFDFTASGNDIMVILDNIHFSEPDVVPEPAASAFLLGAGALILGFRRRMRSKIGSRLGGILLG
jgi:hypothetical protein